jgi:predicted dinucleotide-binding enzyme
MVQCYVDQLTQVLDQHADTFLCGDDAEAKALVTALAGDIGMGAVDVGPLANASLIDALTRMWGQITRSKGRGIAFKVLTRET